MNNTSYIEVKAHEIVEKLSKALVNTQMVLERNTREQPRLKAAESRLRDLTKFVTFATVESRILLSLEDVLLIQEHQV
jgi:hypothetical protein